MKNPLKEFSSTADEVPEINLNIETESLKLLKIANQTQTEMAEFYPEMLNIDASDETITKKYESLKRASSNITKALTKTYGVTDEFGARWKDIKKKKGKKSIFAPPANSQIDLDENLSSHFAIGINIYKILLICYIGSLAGVVIELIWCLITNGHLESRSGLVYGPFNLLYGVGAVVLSVCLYNFRNHSSRILFLGGIVIGSAVEYACSWGQELLFGSRSWDYSHMPFNINGRICLLYSFFWGFLGVFWIKNIYPRIAKLILKIPDKIGKIATWALAVFFVFNSIMSTVSTYRWSQRVNDIKPSNNFWEFIDERFPDERMKKIYSNMEFSK